MGANAKADEIIYSNLGPDGSFLTNTAAAIIGDVDGSGHPDIIGAGFTPLDDFTLTGIRAPITWVQGFPEVQFEVAAPAPDGSIGQVLSSVVLEILPATSTTADLSDIPINSVPLEGGIQYWLYVVPGDASTTANWFANNQGYNASFFNTEFGFYEDQGIQLAFEIDGIPKGSGNDVPEIDPNSASTALTILAGVMLIFKTQKRGK